MNLKKIDAKMIDPKLIQKIEDLELAIGGLENLKTTERTNLVLAINEIKELVNNTEDEIKNWINTNGFGDFANSLIDPDVNTLEKNGIYYINNGINIPLGLTHGYLMIQAMDADNATQFFVNSLDNKGQMFKRNKINSVWSEWYRIIDETMKDVANGFAGLDENGKLKENTMPKSTKLSLDYLRITQLY